MVHSSSFLFSRSATAKKRPGRKLADEVADESRSTQVTVAADMVFSSSKNLSGVSIFPLRDEAR